MYVDVNEMTFVWNMFDVRFPERWPKTNTPGPFLVIVWDSTFMKCQLVEDDWDTEKDVWKTVPNDRVTHFAQCHDIYPREVLDRLAAIVLNPNPHGFKMT